MGLPAHAEAAFRLGELPTARARDERTWEVVLAGHVVALVTLGRDGASVSLGVPGGAASVAACDAWGYEYRRLLGLWPPPALYQAAHASIAGCMPETARGDW